MFCITTVVCLGLEAKLVWSMIDKGFSGGSTVAAVMNTLVLGGVGLLFKRLVEDTFVKPELLPMSRLRQFATERSGILESARKSNQDEFDVRKALVTNTLQFVESTLRGWVPGEHFELCVFVDAQEPLLFSYFDSNHDTVARSMVHRESNSKFYIENDYEVTKVLENPTSQPRIIGDTHDTKSGYKFTTDQQRHQIRSSVLLSLDLGRPLAFVLSSDAKGAFKAPDSKLFPFIRYAGELIRSDLLDDGFVDRICSSKSELFPARALVNEVNVEAQIEVQPALAPAK